MTDNTNSSTSKKKNHYIDNKKFLEEIIKYKEAKRLALENDKEPPRLNDYLGQCISLIANKMAFRPEFYRYTFIEEMVGDAIENMILYFDNFDPTIVGEKSGTITPFGYFSRVTYFAFQRRIMKEQKQYYTKNKYFETFLVSVDGNTLEEYNPAINFSISEKASNFIEKYERREDEKKKKRDEKKRLLLKEQEENEQDGEED